MSRKREEKRSQGAAPWTVASRARATADWLGPSGYPLQLCLRDGHSVPQPFCDVTTPLTCQEMESIPQLLNLACLVASFHQKNVGRSETVKPPRLSLRGTFRFRLCT